MLRLSRRLTRRANIRARSVEASTAAAGPPSVEVEIGSATLTVTLEEHERIGNVVALARHKLRAFATLDEGMMSYFLFRPKMVAIGMTLGGFDGIGALLKMATFDVTGDGVICTSDIHSFQSEGALLTEQLQAGTLNYTVVYSLFLTIFVSLAVLHAGRNAYEIPEEDVALRIGSYYSEEGREIFADLATYAWPADFAAQLSLRRSLYEGEYISLAFGTVACIIGLLDSLLLYISMSTALPSVICKLEYIVGAPWRLVVLLWLLFFAAVPSLMLALLFIAARASAFAAFCFGAGVLCFLFWEFFFLQSSHGSVTTTLRHEHSEARRLLCLGQRTTPRLASSTTLRRSTRGSSSSGPASSAGSPASPGASSQAAGRRESGQQPAVFADSV